jgi:hypothetical protein
VNCETKSCCALDWPVRARFEFGSSPSGREIELGRFNLRPINFNEAFERLMYASGRSHARSVPNHRRACIKLEDCLSNKLRARLSRAHIFVSRMRASDPCLLFLLCLGFEMCCRDAQRKSVKLKKSLPLSLSHLRKMKNCFRHGSLNNL